MATIARWGWLCPVSLAMLGIIVAFGLDDYSLANRSASVLLLSLVLVSAHELLS